MIISNCGAGKDSWAFLGINEIKQVNLKGNQPWIFNERTDADTEAPILWPPNPKSWLTGKYPDVEKDWRQEEKGILEDEMVGWHHRLWTWVWASSGSWWWTEKPGVLESLGSQWVKHDWATELNLYVEHFFKIAKLTVTQSKTVVSKGSKGSAVGSYYLSSYEFQF